MNKSILIFTALIMAIPAFVGAQTASVTPKFDREWKTNMTNLREKIRVERKNLHLGTSTLKGEENKEIRKQAREDIKDTIKDLRSQKVGIFVDHLLQRISLQIKNLENLLTRTNSRVKDMAVAGKDVTVINTKLSEAQTSLNNAKSDFALLPAKLDLIRTSSSTKVVNEAKEIASTTIVNIKNTHAKIVEVISLIKNAK